MNEFKLKIKPLMEELAKDKILIHSFLLISAIVTWILGLFLKIGLFYVSILLMFTTIFFFMYTKDLGKSEPKDKKKTFWFTTITCCFSVAEIFNTLIWSTKFYFLSTFSPFILALIIIGAIIYFVSTEEGKRSFKLAINESVYSHKGMVIEKKLGDAQIGVDADTGQPVIIPLKDRYLHTMIYGATGTGKTSQSLIPMIYDDMQNSEVGVIVLEPKGDLAEKVYAMAKLTGREDAIYFNPIMENCPYFNPLLGDEDDVIENLVTTFKTLDPDSGTFFKDNAENLIRRGVKVIKRLYGNNATLMDLDDLINNIENRGTNMVKELKNKAVKDVRVLQDNRNICAWFLDDYFSGNSGQRGGTKTFEHTSGLRNQVSKLISNRYVSRVLNPPKDVILKDGDYVDFDKIMRDGGVIAITTAQGKLRDLSKFLGYFLILQIQSSVFRRPGNEDTRRGCFFYSDEFQTYANAGFSEMLTQGRSYRVASILATQNRALVGMNSGSQGKNFLELVSTNARNVIIYPGGNVDDSTYFSKAFGENLIHRIDKSYSRQLSLFGKKPGSESVKESDVYENRFRASDLVYKEFGEVVYSVVQNNTLKPPGVSKLSFLPREVSNQIDDFVTRHNKLYEIKNVDPVEDVIHNEPISFMDDDGEIDINFENDLPVLNTDNRSATREVFSAPSLPTLSQDNVIQEYEDIFGD